MHTLEPQTVPLQSINLIEASAGTGKSWTVTLLYLRLILEKSLTVDQILVVTFTDAATKELRDAIRNRLVEALDYFEQPIDDPEKDEYKSLFDAGNYGSIDAAISRLNRAKLSLDEAAIFTIHSFCQRALNENAFDAGLPFESQLMDDDREIMQKLSDDFWRRRFETAPKFLLFKLNQKKGLTPDSLLNDIRFAVGKPYLENCVAENEDDNSQFEKLEKAFQRAKKTWCKSCEEIESLMCDPSREAQYNKIYVKARDFVLAEMNKMSASSALPITLDSKLSWLGERDKTTAKFDSLEHSFFKEWQEFYSLWLSLNKLSDGFLNRIRIDLLEYLREELPKEKQRLGLLSFDDLLLNLQQTIHARPELCNDLRKKYPAALIDEFQDTDPIQYDIFSSIYQFKKSETNECIVFLVGDPKQAIYSFRGGDIHTYLGAKSDVDANNQYTLETNWRSHKGLISAFNTLYNSADNPFYDKGIDYHNVKAGTLIKQHLSLAKQVSPLRFWRFDLGDDKPLMADIRQQIADAVASDITVVLNAAKQGHAKIGEQAVRGGDIAILVRSHTQGDLIKLALNNKGIASVQSSKDSIFETHEADEMIILLTALVDPQREDNVRRALVTELLGHSAEDLLRFDTDSNAWETTLLAMQGWQLQWKTQGFLPMFRSLLKAQSVHQHLMAYVDGERRITNVLHLSEIIHQQSRKLSLGLEEVLHWLKLKKENITKGSAEAELRLESDENLVKIVTIHKSKGLEYPIVYCPFVGLSGKAHSEKIYSFHKDGNSYLEIGSDEVDTHKTIKDEELRAEDARLLYVALTRAKYQCTVVCIPENISGSPDKTALGWLLSDGAERLKGSSNAAKESVIKWHETYAQNLILLSQNNNNISLEALPVFDEGLYYQTAQNTKNLQSKTFTTEIKSQAQITSFSGLTSNAHDNLHIESPDHDGSAKKALPELQENEFPRGPTAGNALHEIYENIDFSVAVAEQAEAIAAALNKWGFDQKHQESASVLMEQSLQAELFDGFSLSQLSNQKRLNEMEFYLPLEQLRMDDLKQILYKHLPEDWQVVRDAVGTLDFAQVEGYLKGFIDLIFEHDGKYYVADYKSNTLHSYDSDALLPVMADSHYYLQYLLYSVALHRYLQKRLTDYSWESQFGGVYYLFIRGMEKTSKKRGGVFFNKPDQGLIDALDGVFMESML